MDLAPAALEPLYRSRSANVQAATPYVFSLYAGTGQALASHRTGMIVTPNLDHLRLLGLSKALRRAYARADVIVNDSRFLDRLAITGRALCLPGSELAPQLLDTLQAGSHAVIIGCAPTVQVFLRERYPRLAFTFADPSMGYIRRRGERRRLAAEVLEARPDCVFVCTGAPQSELMAAQLKRAGCTATILCCGSAFNFLSGAKARAPELFQRLGAEWVWRFAGEAHTRRRYAADALFLLAHPAAFLTLRRTGKARFGAFVLRASSH